MKTNVNERIGVEKLNNQGCLMKVIAYKNSENVLVEFQDKYKYKTNCIWGNFIKGSVKNLYYPTVYGVGITGNKYPTKDDNGKDAKEYKAWASMLHRSYILKYKENFPTYKDVICCEEWLYYPNFYEWMHTQENFEKLMELKDIQVDKDILIKGNKIYSPKTCCLVPNSVNGLFIKSNATRGGLPIGVTYKTRDHVYEVQCRLNGKETYLGRTRTPEEGFLIYKEYKESYIKKIAQEEYDKGNIIKKCYEAMMNYQVEITD